MRDWVTVPVSIATCHLSEVSRVRSVISGMWPGERRQTLSWTRMGCSCLAGGARLDELMRMPCTALGESDIQLQVRSANLSASGVMVNKRRRGYPTIKWSPVPSLGMSVQCLITSLLTDCVRLYARAKYLNSSYNINGPAHTKYEGLLWKWNSTKQKCSCINKGFPL